MPEQNPPLFDEIPNSGDFGLNNDESLLDTQDLGAGETEPYETLRELQDLTLAEFLLALRQSPQSTWAAFKEILRSDAYNNSHLIAVPLANPIETSPNQDFWRQIIRLSLYALAFILVVIGNFILAGDIDISRTEDKQLASGAPYIILGILIWVFAEIFANWPKLQNWWSQGSLINTQSPNINETSLDFSFPTERLFLALVAMILSTWAWFNSTNNNFAIRVPLIADSFGAAEIAIALWIISVLLWAWVFAPLNFNPLKWTQKKLESFSKFSWRKHILIILALIVIMAFAFHFRFSQLDTIPLEMTDDHVEKILDSGLIHNGYRPIFLSNNGGREPFHMYLIALVSNLPGLGINFYTLKWLSAVESFLTIPVLFWLGYELSIGTQRRRLLVGLILAALVAVSYWHVAITRQGLRIPLTPLVVALELIYLARAIRHNSRADFIKAGLILGFGLYTYQAVRMLPVVIVVAVITAIIFKAKTIQERLKYLLNLSVLVGISFAAFIPMFHYSVEYPDLFWRRTAGRLLGDDIIQETLPDGTLVYRDATFDERMNAFSTNINILGSNIRNVFLMFNWQGDIATISGVSMRPSMDILSASLLILGLIAWMAYALRRGDIILALMPVIIFIMLMPSALALALPGENPSHTRASGAIPPVYLLAAFPLALAIDILLKTLKNWAAYILAALLAIVILLGSYLANSSLYFDIFPSRYVAAFDPYSDAGDYLYGFVLTGGTYGNAFLVGAEHWWSHRAVGLEAGLSEFWPNGILPRTAIPAKISEALNRNDRFRLNPEVDMIFFYSPNDEETAAYLAELFPTGSSSEYPTHKANETFMIYRVPALGATGFQAWLEAHPTS